MSPTRIAEGPDAAIAAHAIAEAQKRRNLWPYTHVFPPPTARRRTPEGLIVVQAQGTTAVVLEFPVDSQFKFVLQGLLLTLIPASLFEASGIGSFLFFIDKNVPLGGEALQGSPLTDWSNIQVPYGSITNGPVKLACAEVFAPNDIIRVKVTNNTVNVGAPNYFLARLDGYQIPVNG